MSVNPRKRFGIKSDVGCAVFAKGDFTVAPERFLSMGRATPFAGRRVAAECVMTVYNGNTVYKL